MLISKWAALKAFVDSGSIILVLFICFGSATTLFYWTKWVATVLSWNRKDTRQKKHNLRGSVDFSAHSLGTNGAAVLCIPGSV